MIFACPTIVFTRNVKQMKGWDPFMMRESFSSD